jgi:hypothetical protein
MPDDIINQFKDVIEEYCKDALYEPAKSNLLDAKFNWGTALTTVPKDAWEKGGIKPVEKGTPLDTPTQMRYKLPVKAEEPILSPELQKDIESEIKLRGLFQKIKEADKAKQPTLSPDDAKSMLNSILAKLGKENKSEQPTHAKDTKNIDAEPTR